MKTKYYVCTGEDYTVRYWMHKNGINYYCLEESCILEIARRDIDWEDFLKRKIVREVKIEELPFL